MKKQPVEFQKSDAILYLQTFAFNVGEMGVRVGIGYFVYPFAAFTGTPISLHLHAKEKGTWKV